MGDVSTTLRVARECAGLRLEDISARTKIKLLQLQALERGEFDRLPGEFFTRAFLRTYAREVGLSADEIVREYDESRRPMPLATAGVPAAASAPFRTAPAIATADGAPGARAMERQDGPWSFLSPQRAWPALAFGIVLLLVFALTNREPQGLQDEPVAVSTSGEANAVPSPAPTSGQGSPPQLLTMEIAPSAEIWITGSADGRRAVYRLVQPGERVKIEARDELSFRVGNAGAFHYTLNGVQGRAVGLPGEVREFQITRDNFRTFYR